MLNMVRPTLALQSFKQDANHCRRGYEATGRGTSAVSQGKRSDGLRCDGCIAVHAAAAREHGATKEESSEALAVAVGINAGAAVVYSTRALDAFDAAGEA
jgi:hypothetical protein